MSELDEAKGMIRSLFLSMNASVGFSLPRGWEMALIGKTSRETLDQALGELTVSGDLDGDGTLTQQGFDQWLQGGS